MSLVLFIYFVHIHCCGENGNFSDWDCDSV